MLSLVLSQSSLPLSLVSQIMHLFFIPLSFCSSWASSSSPGLQLNVQVSSVSHGESRRESLLPEGGFQTFICDVSHLQSLALPKLSQPFLVARRKTLLRMHHQETWVNLECRCRFQRCMFPWSIWLPPNGKIVCQDESKGPKL